MSFAEILAAALASGIVLAIAAAAAVFGFMSVWRYAIDFATRRSNYGYIQHWVQPVIGLALIIVAYKTTTALQAAWGLGAGA